jgi:hypothetical protein
MGSIGSGTARGDHTYNGVQSRYTRMSDHARTFEEQEVPFTCPYCAAPITMLVDPSVPEQSYIEDCEVCCRPIEVHYVFGPTGVEVFDARRMD